MKKIVKIRDKNRKIHFRHREVRTPVSLEIDDSEIVKLQMAMNMADVRDYSIGPVKKLKEEKEEYPVDEIEKEEVVIEELDINTNNEPKTLLEKFMKIEE